ncbi:uncharacterized protein DUF4244 [Flavimobilis soli]|uniref:Uncharacterized protein DUF4244 n=1 Tax=Flavimobilis soli TaxID=442709 RepID=A0A2A9EG52_9MICO|nr:DUF4244 domain-containing protein [Flavimobilis soli]PFG37232.1 uncharacterized protein DUF4244 [Flavimobilis soli]
MSITTSTIAAPGRPARCVTAPSATLRKQARRERRTTTRVGRVAARARARWGRAVAHGRDAGLATAEYAVVLIAAVGFAGLLLVILSSNEVRGTLLGLVQRALAVG